MKKVIALFIFLISTSGFASGMAWEDLTVTRAYKLTQDITFDDGTIIKKDEVFKLQEASDSISSNYYEFQAKTCLEPNKKSSKSVFKVTQDPENPVYVIATLRKYCNVDLELDRRDINTISPFSK